ncbi:MAG: DUF885 family protein [Gemmatimonadaceae bacterium]|nr:DUF885 family protein [Gemmatimonadaceae bacterium]
MRRLRAELADTEGATVAAMRRNPVLLDGELARANLDVRLAEHDSGYFHARNPALWTGEAIFGVVGLMIRDFAPLPERLPAIAARLRAIPAFLAALPAAITVPVPAPWLARAARECDAADGLFDRGLRAWLVQEGVGDDAAAPVLEAATQARAAFATLGTWVDAHQFADEADCAVGNTTFSILLRRGHCCDRTPRELLEAALAQLPRQQERLAAMLEEFGGTWEGAQAALAADRPTTATYYATFERRWHDCRAIVEAHDAVTWGDWPIRYVPIPPWAREFAPQLYWLFYRSPAPFDPYTVYDYVVTPVDATMPHDEQERRLRAWNNSTITLNHVVHHGAVGHHVQNWHARYRATSRIGRIAATDCASRIAMFQGGSMAEGWACYATLLMGELGMLTPLEQLSEQHTTVRMLARAIVDIRLHLQLCTFGEAVQFYQDVVGMSMDVATAETTKNSMFPCTALMYWLGTGTILALREELRLQHEVRGTPFVLRTFHDELLSRGAIPVMLAATLMTEGDT